METVETARGILSQPVPVWIEMILFAVMVVPLLAMVAWLAIGVVVSVARLVWLSFRTGDTDGAFSWWFCFEWAQHFPRRMHAWWEKRRK